MIRRLTTASIPLVLLALYAADLRVAHADVAVPPARVEAIARLCVAEAGWDVGTGDCAAIATVITRRAERRGVRPVTMARLYSTRHFDRTRTDARRWIADLELDAHEPAGWPAALPWRGRYRAAWLATVAYVGEVLAGRVEPPCVADHWGAPYGGDLRRALRAGWTRLDCGPTRNAFWSLEGDGPSSAALSGSVAEGQPW